MKIPKEIANKIICLFRAKNKLTKKWVYGDLVHIKDGDRYIPHIYGEGEIIPETITSITGKVDIENKDIYNMDICRFYEDDGESSDYLITWDKDRGKFIIRWLVNGAEDDFDAWFAKHCKVIGNAYDNAELLKKIIHRGG